MNRNQIATKMYGKFMSDLSPDKRDVVDSIHDSRDLQKLLNEKDDY